MLLQSYDFVVLNRDYGRRVQFGGSASGNIAGIDRTPYDRNRLRLTSKLLVKSDAKDGKNRVGRRLARSNRTSPYHFYQYWINVDADIPNVFLPICRIRVEQLLTEHEKDRENGFRKQIAMELTRLVHERSVCRPPKGIEIFFGAEVSLSVLTRSDFRRCAGEISRTELRAGLPLIDALVPPNSQFEETPVKDQQSGAYVNNRRRP